MGEGAGKRVEAQTPREAQTPYAPGAGWIAGQPDQKPVEHFYLGDIRHLDPMRVLADLHLAVGEAGRVVRRPAVPGLFDGRQ